MHRDLSVIVLLWTFGVGIALAEPATDALEAIYRCSAIADSTERLKCFDRTAQAAKDARTPREADFGKPPPDRPAEVEQIVALVTELSRTSHGRAVFVLDNGQTWRQLDSDDVQVLDPAPGKAMRVTIGHGLFGSYTLTVQGRNGFVRVRRAE